jgi:multicomponent Na+:H+ antiporter subunit G
VIPLLVGILMVVGAGSMFLAAVGLIRMPDVYLRASSSTKAATLGVIGMLLAAAVFFGDAGIATRSVAIILFVFLTAPVAAHMIGRAAYLANTPMWEGTIVDELKGRYDPRKEVLHSSPPDDGAGETDGR